jgi:hypothetical protein
MKQFLPTVVIGAFFALVAAFIVLLYWLMLAVFRVLYVLTLPVHFLWRANRT